MNDATCRSEKVDPNLFFPERGQLTQSAKARFYCSQCPVSNQCEDYRERTNSAFGIWAGKLAYEKGDKNEQNNNPG